MFTFVQYPFKKRLQVNKLNISIIQAVPRFLMWLNTVEPGQMILKEIIYYYVVFLQTNEMVKQS